MIDIQGIVDTVLDGVVCFRGFANIDDIKKISSSGSYQRDLIPEHKNEIQKFYKKQEYLFFPEVILGAAVDAGVHEKIKNNTRFTITGKYTLYLRKQKRAKLRIYSDQILFSRIDGNHRLEAATDDIVGSMSLNKKIPFCIIFTATDNAKMERIIFNNINFKNKPLRMQENLSSIINSDDNLIEDYGEEYSKTKKVITSLLPACYEELKGIFTSSYLEVIFELVNFLKLKAINKTLEEVTNAIQNVLHLQEGLKFNKGLFIAMVYFGLESDKKLKTFKTWIKKYHLSKLSEVSAIDLVDIYSSIYDVKSRQIFVSMPFGRTEADNHFTLICEVVDEINRSCANTVSIPPPIRIDSLQATNSYNIHKKIYEGLENSAFLIADLTYARPNVYHEVGYAMGIAKANKFEDNVLLIIHKNPENCQNPEDYKVHFNLSCNSYIVVDKIEAFKREVREKLLIHFDIK